MARTARIVVPGFPYHVTQRGNNRQDVFFTGDDRRVYLALLRKQARAAEVSVLGYCLMTNHVHLVLTPPRKDALAEVVGRVSFSYTQYLNDLRDRTGHLWHGRYRSYVMDEDYLLAAMRYVECNPVRAGLAGQPWDYPWSSARAHCGLGDDADVLDLRTWGQYVSPADWKAVLRRAQPKKELEAVRTSHHTGRPLGGEGFVSKVETMLGRRILPRPVGRPGASR